MSAFDSDEEEDGHVEKYVERQFNFVAEFSNLVDYNIISKYC